MSWKTRPSSSQRTLYLIMKEHSLALKTQGMIKEKDLDDLIFLQNEINEKGAVDCETGFGLVNLILKDKDSLSANTKEFKRLMYVLIEYGLVCTIRSGSKTFFAPTELSVSRNIFDIFEEEKKKRDADFIAAKLDAVNLKLNKFLLKTKWLPHIASLLALTISIFALFREDCACDKGQKQKTVIQELKSMPNKDSI